MAKGNERGGDEWSKWGRVGRGKKNGKGPTLGRDSRAASPLPNRASSPSADQPPEGKEGTEMKRNLPIQARIPIHIIFHPSLLSL
jgi:hypothetical protein